VLLTANAIAILRVFARANPAALEERPWLQKRLALCSRDPSSWRSVRVHRLRLDAFDGTTWAPADPTGDSLDDALRQRLTRGDQAPVSTGYFLGLGTRVAWRRGAGPCGIIQAGFGPSRATLGNLVRLWGAALVMAAVALLTAHLFILRPLRVRVRRLRASAERLGEAVGGVRAPQASEDLEVITEAIEIGIESHRQAAAQLAQRGDRLERHLVELAHDLRTPLAALQLALERMVGDSLPDERRHLAARALAELVYATTLLENLDTATTVSAGLPSGRGETEVDLGIVLQAIVARFALLAQQRSIDLALSHPDEPVIVRTVATLIERGLGNLVHNAVRHGRPGGHIAVLLSQHGPTFTLTVEDDGPGLSDELLRSVAHAKTTTLRGVPRADGTQGIGLAVANLAFERAHMQVRYERASSGGLLVTLRGNTK
jgi:signal transduction histidine kinase